MVTADAWRVNGKVSLVVVDSPEHGRISTARPQQQTSEEPPSDWDRRDGEYHHAIPRSRWAMSETPSPEALSQRRSISLQPRSQSRLPYVVGGGTGVGRPGVAGAGFGALANSHLRRQMGQVFLLCSHVLMHMR